MGEVHRFSRSTAEEGPRGGREEESTGSAPSPQRGCTGRSQRKNRAVELPSEVAVQRFFSSASVQSLKIAGLEAQHCTWELQRAVSRVQLLAESYWLLSLFLAGQAYTPGPSRDWGRRGV